MSWIECIPRVCQLTRPHARLAWRGWGLPVSQEGWFLTQHCKGTMPHMLVRQLELQTAVRLSM
jgi:hypothetical protein